MGVATVLSPPTGCAGSRTATSFVPPPLSLFRPITSLDICQVGPAGDRPVYAICEGRCGCLTARAPGLVGDVELLGDPLGGFWRRGIKGEIVSSLFFGGKQFAPQIRDLLSRLALSSSPGTASRSGTPAAPG